MSEGRKGGYDVVILDTAGRLHIDQELMDEVAQVRDAVNPAETLLVTDAMIGQDAVNLAREFNEKIGISGIVLTRVDGDARGGAALSMRAVTGKPIKLLGMGEKLHELEGFHADRIVGRILGMGDVVSLVERAAESIEAEEAEKMAAKLMEGKFDMNDMLSQLRQIQKMGDIKGILGMMPGIGKMQKQLENANIDDKMIKHQEAIILSMTAKERANPALLKASRKKRVAAGSGVSVQEINKLLKQHQQMADVMKRMKKMGGKKGLMGAMSKMFGGATPPAGMPGGMPPGMTPDMLAGMAGGKKGKKGAGGDDAMPDLSALMKGGGAGGLPPDVLKALSKGKKK
jgi:signal recognition particle subunit SRP54